MRRVLGLANALSAARLVLAPVLLALAWQRRADAFLWCLVASLGTDVLDGWVARRFGQTSRVGAVLDSLGDLFTYSVVPVCAVWLHPEVLERERAAFWTTVACFLGPVAVGLLRFRRLTSYHTRTAKVAAYAVGAGAVAVFAGWGTLPFRLAVPFLVVSALENLAITAVLPSWRPDVPTIFHALAIRREMLATAGAASAHHAERGRPSREGEAPPGGQQVAVAEEGAGGVHLDGRGVRAEDREHVRGERRAGDESA